MFNSKIKKVVILGGIGNGTVIADAIVYAKIKYGVDVEVAGFLNDRVDVGEKVQNYRVIGNLSNVSEFVEKGYFFINTIYRIDGQRERIELFESLLIPENQLFTFIHPTSYVAPTAKIGPGAVIMPNVSISSDAIIGNCSLVMVNSTVGHNSIIGDYTHLAAQSCISSFVTVGRGAHLGLNCTVRESLIIGENSTLGMGSVLLKNIPDSEIWVGNPAKFLRKVR